VITRRHITRAVLVSAALLLALSSRRPENGVSDAWCNPLQAARKGAASARPWPVDVPVHLSSSFGEFRGGHLHAGVDIRSFGREGVACRSVGRGYVARLRASPDGYGEAVYVKLDSGETVVYAHLSEFAPDIDSVVHAAQIESERYQVDVYPAPGDLPVEEGQIIAYTGRTGAAAPHLHFEVRDAGERPVNPLDAGWTLRDDVPPTIRRLQCLPLATDARVNGRFADAVVELRSSDARTFVAPDTLLVHGAVGFGAQIIDRVGGSSGNLAPFRVELEIDGRRVTTVEMRRFAYDQAAEVELVYDMARARARGQHYLLLFRRGGETLSDREFADDGVIRVAGAADGAGNGDGVHLAVVRATDHAGNVSTATWAFVACSPDSSASSTSVVCGAGRGAPGIKGELPGFFFFEGMMGVQGLVRPGETVPRPAGPNDTPERTEGEEAVFSGDTVGESGRTLFYRLGESTRKMHVFAARRDGALHREFADLGVGITVGEGSLWTNTLLYLTSWEESVAGTLPADAGLRVATPGVRLGPLSAAFKAPVAIRFHVEGAPRDDAAVFRFDERSRTWSFRRSSSGVGTVDALVREPGVYAVLVDSLAPTIGAPHLASRRSFASGSNVREVVVPITDGGCGVDAGRTEVYLDGRKQIARWDGFLEKMFVILRDKNIMGLHDLSVVAMDRLGNSTRLVTQLQVPPPTSQGGTGGSR
jgi:hypothetical protein